MKCPHCNRGKLIPSKKPMTDGRLMHTCDVCGRGWTQDEKGNWHSHFATDIEVWSPNGKKLIDSSTWHMNDKR